MHSPFVLVTQLLLPLLLSLIPPRHTHAARVRCGSRIAERSGARWRRRAADRSGGRARRGVVICRSLPLRPGEPQEIGAGFFEQASFGPGKSVGCPWTRCKLLAVMANLVNFQDLRLRGWPASVPQERQRCVEVVFLCTSESVSSSLLLLTHLAC